MAEWSKVPPTKPGFYGWSFALHGRVHIIRVIRTREGNLMADLPGGDVAIMVTQPPGWWWPEPLVVPWEGK